MPKTPDVVLVCATVLMLCLSSPGWAQGPKGGPESGEGPAPAETKGKESEAREAEFSSRVKAGMEAFGSNDFATAAENFTAAYEIKQVANLLYNIGRAYEQLGELEKAIETYDKFVVAPGVDIRARKDALDRLKTLREILRMREKGDKQDDPNKKPRRSLVRVKPRDEGPSYTAAYVVWGIGGLALIGSGIFALLTNSSFSDFENASDINTRRRAANTGSTYAVVSDSMLIGGLAAVALGTVLFFLEDGPSETDTGADPSEESDDEDESARITPMWSPEGWSVGVSWRF